MKPGYYDLSDNTWTLDANTTQPGARFTHGLSETSMDGSSFPVLFGGWYQIRPAYDNETWTFGGGDYLPQNSPPVATNDAHSVDEDTLLDVTTPGVLGNDSDANGDPLTAALVSGPSNGTLIFNSDGSFTYTSDVDFNGTDAFTYEANDGELNSNEATVTITINPVDDVPVAVDDAYNVDEDNTLTMAVSGVLSNDSDVDGDPLTSVLISGPSNGTLTLNADGSFTYTPKENFNGTDSFTYKANDGALYSNEATVIITVNPVNDAPDLASIDDKEVNEGEELQFTVSATDPDGDAVTYSATNLPPGASFDPATQVFSWIPDFTQAGSYPGVHFEVTDGELTDSEEITIIVNDVTPIELIEDLTGYIESLNLPKGTENSLTSKLYNAIKSLEKGHYNAAINQLNAFINEVEALRGKKLTEEQADALIEVAEKAIDAIYAEEGEKAAKLAVALPDHFALFQNRPNPFNPITAIVYDLPEASHVTLTIYTVTGQHAATLVSDHQEAGHYEVAWDGSGFGAGIYFYRLEAGQFAETKRMLLLK